MAQRKKMLTAVFRNRANAQTVHDWLMSRGYQNSEMSVLMSDATRTKYYSENGREHHDVGNMATEGLGVGGAIGTVVGAGIAAIAAIGTAIAIPGLGLVVAGPIAAALAGGGAGAVTGGVLGTLIGLGIPESNARAYEAALREGGVAIGVVPRSDDDADAIKEEFESLDGENICYC